MIYESFRVNAPKQNGVGQLLASARAFLFQNDVPEIIIGGGCSYC